MNRVTVTGNLTTDPELRELPSGSSVGRLRLAVDSREKVDGEWQKRPNFFDITVWGSQAENAERFLGKGRRIGVDGRLRWREWETDDGQKRQAVEIVADQITYLDGPKAEPSADQVSPTPAAEPVAVGAGTDIPF